MCEEFWEVSKVFLRLWEHPSTEVVPFDRIKTLMQVPWAAAMAYSLRSKASRSFWKTLWAVSPGESPFFFRFSSDPLTSKTAPFSFSFRGLPWFTIWSLGGGCQRLSSRGPSGALPCLRPKWGGRWKCSFTGGKSLWFSSWYETSLCLI